MLTAITLLPALLGYLGPRVLSRKGRRQLAENGPHPVGTSGNWLKWSTLVSRRPVVLAVGAAVALAVLCVPAFSLHVGSSDAGSDPAGSTTRNAYDLLGDGFGAGFNGPLQLLAKLPTDADRAAFADLATTLSNVPGVASASAVPLPPTSTIGVIAVSPTCPEVAATSQLITHLRQDVLPAAAVVELLRRGAGTARAPVHEWSGAP